MKYFCLVALICALGYSCGSTAQPSQQQYRSHTVAKGETVFSISQKYNVDERDIYRLNPDARNGVQTNAVIILPSSSTGSGSDVSFRTHRVKKRETLFSISQQYNVSQDELKKYNKELYARQLKTGEKLRIPIGKSVDDGPGSEITAPGGKDFARHTVLPKETIFGIARKYGISVAELKQLNPDLDENIQIGAILKVPEQSVTESATIEDDQFDFYEVKPKEGFFRIKEKFGLTEEQVIQLNPYAKDGLKEGMVLKVPKEGAQVDGDAATVVELENRIANRSRKRLAVLLPFMLNRVNADSIQANAELLKRERTIQVALDFYSGVLMAAQFAKDKGIPVTLNVYDTQANSGRINELISQKDFEGVDAVIGPLLSANVENTAANLRGKNIPVFSPLSNRDIKMYPNLFQTIPSDAMLQEAMLDYLKQNSAGKNVIVISDASRKAQKEALLEKLPNAKTLAPREEGFLYAGDIAAKVNTAMENWVVLESTNPVLVSNVVGLLNGMPDSHRIRLFTLDKGKVYDYDDISNMHLAKLNFTFPSVNRTYDYNEKNPFLISYKNEYGVLPNKYAVRGFDLTYDVLLRLAYSEEGLGDTAAAFETEYLENKFRYGKELFSGYENKALYIIKYNQNLQFEVAE